MLYVCVQVRTLIGVFGRISEHAAAGSGEAFSTWVSLPDRPLPRWDAYLFDGGLDAIKYPTFESNLNDLKFKWPLNRAGGPLLQTHEVYTELRSEFPDIKSPVEIRRRINEALTATPLDPDIVRRVFRFFSDGSDTVCTRDAFVARLVQHAKNEDDICTGVKPYFLVNVGDVLDWEIFYDMIMNSKEFADLRDLPRAGEAEAAAKRRGEGEEVREERPPAAVKEEKAVEVEMDYAS